MRDRSSLDNSESDMFVFNDTNNNNGHPIILDQERLMPIANISRIMKRAVPEHAKLSKEAKECIQECVSEFFLFITSEAAERCVSERRKTITGDDLLASMENLGFESYLPSLKAFMKRYKEATGTTNGNKPDSEDPTEPSPMNSSQSNNISQSQPSQLQAPDIPTSTTEIPSQQSVADSIQPYLPSTFRRVTDIYVDTTNQQHYISAESPGGTAGLIPIEIRGLSAIGQAPQPITIQEIAQHSYDGD